MKRITMSKANEIRENLREQVYELEALQSVFPEELKLIDHGVLADINDFINDATKENPPCRLQYSVAIPDVLGQLEMQVILPSSYPNLDPEIYVRSSVMDRTEQMNLNKSLMSFIESREKGEPVIYSLISWLQDNAEDHIKNKKTVNDINDKEEQEKETEFVRYWVYSHHIYSKVKRREITDLARECSLTGFCLAGKPGIVCIEGEIEDCDYWWHQVKVMNWHRIFIKFKEKEIIKESINDCRKFADFQEISFPTSERHNDMGQLLKYLTQHNSQHVFKELFGIEGKSNSEDKRIVYSNC